MALAHHLQLRDAQAGLFAKGDPLSLRIDAPVGRVAQGFHLVLVGRARGILGRERVDEDEDAAGTQHARHLAKGERHVVEVMRGKSGGDDVEARVREGQALRDGLDEFGVSHADLAKDTSRSRQHGWHRVCQDDARRVGRERERRVASTRPDVEHSFRPLWRGEIDDQLQFAPGFVLAGRVGLGGFLPARPAAHPLSLGRRCRGPA